MDLGAPRNSMGKLKEDARYISTRRVPGKKHDCAARRSLHRTSLRGEVHVCREL